MSTEFQHAIAVNELADPGTMMIEIDERLVVLVHVEDEFFCIDDVCTHDNGPLSEGELQGCQLICPRHGAKFDVRTGKAMTFPAILATTAHEVKVDDGNVYVKINDE
jgi:3-phenylpropionate/trans-cinnamate dioxygenase ferredoxin subunit